MPDIIARSQRRAAAIAADTLSGQLRRAVLAAGVRHEAATEAAGVERRTFVDWMHGDAHLFSTAMDRLAAYVRQKLVAVE